MGGGGLSNVSVRRQLRGVSSDTNIAEDLKHEYLIFGKRLSDQSVSTKRVLFNALLVIQILKSGNYRLLLLHSACTIYAEDSLFL